MKKYNLFVKILAISCIITIIYSAIWYSIEFKDPFYWIVLIIYLSPAIILLSYMTIKSN